MSGSLSPVRSRYTHDLRLAVEPLEHRTLLATVVIDYSLSDGNNFFDPQTANGQAARAAVEAAARVFSDALGDSLDAIVPPGSGNHWTPQIVDPETFNTVVSLPTTMVVPQDQIIVYVAASDDIGLGHGGPGTIFPGRTPDARGEAWVNALFSRGEAGGTRRDVDNPDSGELTAVDFAPWGGSIAFGRNANWHFDQTTPPDADKHDLFSIALHEFAHVLGFGTSDSFANLIDGCSFTGPKAVAAYDAEGNPPLECSKDHWSNGTTDNGNETAMDPSIGRGIRKPFTELDFAALFDLGWENAAELPGRLNGRAFEDANGNGLRDPNESILAGRTVFLDGNGNGLLDAGEPSKVTRNNGRYAFPNLTPGTYRVAVVPDVGFVARAAVADVPGGGTATGVNPVAARPAVIRGLVYQDTDQDGMRDATDPPLAGVVIFLDGDGDGLRDEAELSRTTNANGSYRFRNLFPGIYVVRQEVPAGFVQLTPDDVARQTLSLVGGTKRRLNFGDAPAAGLGTSGARMAARRDLLHDVAIDQRAIERPPEPPIS